MRNANSFSFRPTVEQLADRTLPSVTPIINNLVTVPTDTTVKTSHPTDDVAAPVTLKPSDQVQGRKAGGGQKDW